MVRVTVDLVSAVSRDRDRRIGLALIAAADGTTADSVTADYTVTLEGADGRAWKEVGVRGFPRKRLLAWDLLYRALREAVGPRNDDTERELLLALRRSVETVERLRAHLHDHDAAWGGEEESVKDEHRQLIQGTAAVLRDTAVDARTRRLLARVDPRPKDRHKV
jgi:hypothetical protein